jgi:putative ABC transport system permease protein
VIAPTDDFVKKGGRFTFAGMLADASDGERANPWLLLNRTFPDGATPVIVDQTSLMYVFHRAIGDDIEIRGGGGTSIKLRVVGSLSHSVFQSELIVSEPSFVRLFPDNEGYRLFLVQAKGDEVAIGRTLENRLADFGVEAIATVDRLRAYQQVENTYLSTFQALGALGLVLGTFGVGTVLLRNILERRRELALLQAIGYRESHIRSLILAESVSLVVWGLLAGAACALLAVLPAIVERGGSFPWTAVIVLLAAVLAAGFISTIAATAMAIRLPLLESLRAE